MCIKIQVEHWCAPWRKYVIILVWDINKGYKSVWELRLGTSRGVVKAEEISIHAFAEGNNEKNHIHIGLWQQILTQTEEEYS